MVKIREKSGYDSKCGTKPNFRPPAVPVFVLVCALFLTGSNFMRMVHGNDYRTRLRGQPGIPGMPAFTEATPNTITLLWRPPSDEFPFPTKHYLLHTFIGLERQFEPKLTMRTVQTKFQVKGLTPSTFYSFRVASVRGDTAGPFSHMSLHYRTLKEPRTQVPTTTKMPTTETSSTTTTILPPPPPTTTTIPRTTTTTPKLPGATTTIPTTATTITPKLPGATTTIPRTTTTTTPKLPGATTTIPTTTTTTTPKLPGATTTTEIPETTTIDRVKPIRIPWIVLFMVAAAFLVLFITGCYYGCRRDPCRTIERDQESHVAAMDADEPRVNNPPLETPAEMAILPGTNEESRGSEAAFCQENDSTMVSVEISGRPGRFTRYV